MRKVAKLLVLCVCVCVALIRTDRKVTVNRIRGFMKDLGHRKISLSAVIVANAFFWGGYKNLDKALESKYGKNNFSVSNPQTQLRLIAIICLSSLLLIFIGIDIENLPMTAWGVSIFLGTFFAMVNDFLTELNRCKKLVKKTW
jgi:hypothetical protein